MRAVCRRLEKEQTKFGGESNLCGNAVTQYIHLIERINGETRLAGWIRSDPSDEVIIERMIVVDEVINFLYTQLVTLITIREAKNETESIREEAKKTESIKEEAKNETDSIKQKIGEYATWGQVTNPLHDVMDTDPLPGGGKNRRKKTIKRKKSKKLSRRRMR